MAAARRDSDPALFGVEPVKRRGRGRHERRVDQAVVAATDAGTLDPTHGGLVATLRALARSLDAAELSESPYAVATVARELRVTLDVARMTPTHAAAADPFGALLDSLDDDVPAS